MQLFLQSKKRTAEAALGIRGLKTEWGEPEDGTPRA